MEKTNFEYLASVLEKADTGPIIDEKDWDRKYIAAKVKELIEKYDISWDEEDFIPSDDALADRLFQAGWELALDTGVLCLNTKRQMVWSEDELKGVVDSAPDALPVGEALTRLPPTVPRLRTGGPAISLAASTMAGQCSARISDSRTPVWVVLAPM